VIQKKRPAVLQINYGIDGGAGKASFRLHKGLLSIGEESKYLVKEIDSEIPTVYKIPGDKRYDKIFAKDHIINKYYLYFNRTSLSNTYFSFSYPGYDLAGFPLVRNADILNLHWVEDFLSTMSLHNIFSLGKPVVWTLHDQRPFTGGCHYSAGCLGYEDFCLTCPQLSDDPYNLPHAMLADKVDLFKEAFLTIATPSRWLAESVRRSRLFRNTRIEIIPNSVETDIFSPVGKAFSKRNAGIEPDVTTIMFGACDAKENRKGFKGLLNAIDYCLADERFRSLVDRKKVMIISVGEADTAIKGLNIPLMAKGYIDSDDEMAAAFNMADIFVLPSLEDNLPNTMLEAMACGTPIISFKVGGMPDVIVDNENGKLVERGDERSLGKAILELLFDPEKREKLGKNASRLMRERFNLGDQARSYRDLYEDLLGNLPVKKPLDDVRGARTNNNIYGRNVAKIYPNLMRISLKKMIVRNFRFALNNAVALRMLEWGMRAFIKVAPYPVLTKLDEILK